MIGSVIRLIVTLGCLGTLSVAPAAAQVELPETITITAYGTESSSYAQGVAISNMLSQKYGSSFRIIPGKNDVSRMLLMQADRAAFCMCGISAYFAQEGTEFFAEQGWGPMKVRMLLSNKSDMHMGLGAAADAGIETPADLEGKRVAFVKGGPANNYVVESTLAFGGLTWDDVQVVEFSGFSAAVEGVINGQVDAAAMNTSAGVVERLANSPRGLAWPETPSDNEKGWERLNGVSPYVNKRHVTTGIGVPEEGIEGNGYPFPYWVTLDETESDLVYSLTKAMIEGAGDFIDAAPRSAGYRLEEQDLTLPIPFHEGAVRYFKEAGVWGEEEQAHNDELIRRQEVLATAWQEMLTFDGTEDEFAAKWLNVRSQALEEAGLQD